jgi:2-methylcitrate dehydratase
MLTPYDYGKKAIFDEKTRKIMDKITFSHGGKEYDEKYPEGIPTSVELKTKSGKIYDSGLVMFPGGHARNTTVSLR